MEKEKIESLLILIIFYVFIILSAILVATRFNELTKEGYYNIDSSMQSSKPY